SKPHLGQVVIETTCPECLIMFHFECLLPVFYHFRPQNLQRGECLADHGTRRTHLTLIRFAAVDQRSGQTEPTLDILVEPGLVRGYVFHRFHSSTISYTQPIFVSPVL